MTPPRLILTIIVVTVSGGGCYASHTIPLPGERYECICQWTSELPDVTFMCEPDDTGRLECEPRSCFGTSCVERFDRTSRVNPCTVFEGDPDNVCDAACSDPTYFPTFSTVTGERVGSGTYAGPGLCSSDDVPPREFFFPEVPVDAVRNGFVVADRSTLELNVEGLGNTGVFQPVDGTPVAVQGGACEGVRCPLSINELRLEIPTGVTLDGTAVDSLAIRLAGAAWDAAEADGAGQWRLLGVSAETSVLPLEFFGSVGGETVEGTFSWEQPPAMPDEGPGGGIDLRRISPDPHMHFEGTIRDTIELDDGSVLNAVLTADIFVRFFSGAPVPGVMMAMADVGSTMEPLVVLDGSESYDMLGSAIVDYQWLAIRGDEELRFARGIRTFLPEAMVEWWHEHGYELCLRVHDGEGLFDTTCEGNDGFMNVPDLPEPTCPEVAFTPAMTTRFRELVETAELGLLFEEIQGVTWIIPSDEAFAKASENELKKLFADKKLAEQFVLSHGLLGNYEWKEILGNGVDLSKNLAGKKAEMKGNELGNDIRIPDVPCGKGDRVHRIGRTLTPSLLGG